MVLKEIRNFPKKSGIYKIVSPTGKVYIGQSQNIQQRLRYYLYDPPASTKIGRSIKKYGIENHKVTVLELTHNLDQRELHFIREYNSVEKGLNTIYRNYTIEKSSFKGGGKWSEERKKIHSQKLKKLHKKGHYKNRKNLGNRWKGTMTVRDIRDGKVKRIPKEEYNKDYYVGVTKNRKVPNRCKKIKDTRTGYIYNSVTECYKALKISTSRFYKLKKEKTLLQIP